MTYCVALQLDSGILFASDSRTNAGVDHIATHSKMRVYEKAGDRVIVLLSSGNLAMTQGVVNLVDKMQFATDDTPTIWNATSLYDVAALVGDALKEMQRRDGNSLAQQGIDASSNLIVGGQIGSERQRLFFLYPQGNFIESSRDTPYFQLGESKYGKPILDRVINPVTTHKDAAKCVLISFDSTLRSNISVGMPIDMMWYEKDTLKVSTKQRIRENDPYFSMLRNGWGSGLRKVFGEMPNPDWLE